MERPISRDVEWYVPVTVRQVTEAVTCTTAQDNARLSRLIGQLVDARLATAANQLLFCYSVRYHVGLRLASPAERAVALSPFFSGGERPAFGGRPERLTSRQCAELDQRALRDVANAFALLQDSSDESDSERRRRREPSVPWESSDGSDSEDSSSDDDRALGDDRGYDDDGGGEPEEQEPPQSLWRLAGLRRPD